MKNYSTEAMQLTNLIAFLGKYGDTASHDDTVKYMIAVQQCAQNIGQWDVDMKLDLEYDMLIVEFLISPNSTIEVAFDVDFNEISSDYDLDHLPYEVCNKGLYY